MGVYLGDFAEDAIVYFAFTTNAADGGRESTSASLEEADIVIYSSDGDGTFTAMTLDVSTIIITENPGSQVGVYLIGVNMGNDADFVTGKDYIAVFYPDETVDSQSIAAVLAHWSCENRGVNVARIGGSDVELSSDNRLTVDVGEWNDVPLSTTNPLPNAAADAAGGLVISDAGGFDIDNRTMSATAIANAEVVYNTDFATNYNATRNAWATNVQDLVGTTALVLASGGLANITTWTVAITGNITGNLSGSVGSVTGAVGSVTGAVGSVTGNVGGNLAGSIGSLATQAKADVNAEVDTAISDAGLDHLIVVTSTVDNALADATATVFKTDLTAQDNTYNDQILQFTTGALAGQSKPILRYDQTNGVITVEEAFTDAPSDGVEFVILASHVHPNSQIADTVLDEALSGHTSAGTLGKAVSDIEADTSELQGNQGDWATATGFSTHSAADVWAVGTRVLTANTNLNDPTAAAIADAVWDEVVSGHTTNGTFGKAFTGATNVYIVGINGTITTLDGLDTAQDTQHAATISAINGLNDPTAAAIAAAILAAGDVDGYSVEETLKLCLAALAGKLSGAATTTITIRAADDSKARITATVDADGNRSAVTLDETG